MSIEKLKKHLESEGKTDSWLNLANQFNLTGTNKQKSDKVRKVFNSLFKDLPGISGTSFTVQLDSDWITSNSPVYSFTNTESEYNKQKDWEEFEKWKNSKNIKAIKKTNGIHLVLGCLHIPAHDEKAISAIIRFIHDYKQYIIGFTLVGDVLDMNALSRT